MGALNTAASVSPSTQLDGTTVGNKLRGDLPITFEVGDANVWRPRRHNDVIAMLDRGTLFVSVGDEVYEGSVIGENKRAEDLDVNAVRERKVTNIRSATSEELVKIVPPREMTLDQVSMQSIRAWQAGPRR